ncbi:Ras-related protein Rab-32 [Amphibalanus amphitrite]|uniref:Ras-related protein Rab-32 n=1 Tax=Amphibalanus amphitrite TaxID=1232801 RepID=A0A6A4X4R5_AMPAM|nr:Ras-related protein Rab-32 [Amphibalanus amphitrite]
MGERTRLRLVFLPSVARDGAGERATASPQERHLSAGWREELSGSLEPATPTTPKETTAPWNGSAERSFQGLADAFYKDAHGCVVVFDLGQRRSLRGALRWKRHIDRLCSLPDEQRFPSLLLANKCDVTGGRDVTQWEVEDVVKQADFLTWIEVSAKYNFMVNEAIGYLLRVVLSRAGPPGVDSSVHLTDPDDEPPPSRSCCGAGAGSQTRSRSNESLQASRDSSDQRKEL